MALTKEQVANRALALIGADPITSFTDDDSQEALFCTQIYDGLVEALLTDKPWRFAMKQAELDRLVAEPVGRWTAAYELPADLLRLQAVTCNDVPINYDRYDGKIFSDSDVNDVIVADYIYKANPTEWLPYFTQAFVFYFAGMLGGALARDADLVEKYEKLGEKWMQKAATIDSQSQTTRRIRLTRFAKVRGSDRTNGGFRDDGY
ncbi:MAG: hypothetical protein AB7G80_09530 [Dongiaceae bacterium]